MGKYDFELDVYDNNTIAWIANRVPDNSVVLEFGPANGRLTKYLKETKNCKVDIVEIDEESGTQAAQYAEKAYLGTEQGDIEQYHWLKTDKKYDFIIFADVLEHLLHPQDVLDKCKIVMNHSGNILVSIPNISHNSIIIDLINDRFHYNPTGIMDNTHVRFFTRQSFGDMALAVGWTIIEEKAKQIRVGETEIKNSYQDIPKDIARVLMARPQGDIYQYMFVLALNEELLKGECEHIISLDSHSYYNMQVQYEKDGEFSYRNSVTKQINPYYGNVSATISVLPETQNALLKPINCNCVLSDIHIVAIADDAEISIEEMKYNGKEVAGRIYFVEEEPNIELNIPKNSKALRIEFKVIRYDFEDEAMQNLFSALDHEQHHIRQVCEDYEKVIADMKQQISEKQEEIVELNTQLSEEKKTVKELQNHINEFSIKKKFLKKN